MFQRAMLLTSILVVVSLGGHAQSEGTHTAPVHAESTHTATLQSQTLNQVEAYLRKLFAWGPNFTVKLGPTTPSVSPDYLEVPVQVTANGQTETGSVYVSKDGRYVLRGEILDIKADPFADNRAKIHLEGSPSKGPANATVTVVDYSDYECPHCRELSVILKDIEPRYPQVRFVSKNFPLTQIHPWAMNAAIATHCAAEKSNDSFWSMHDAIFQNQDLISPENAWDKLSEYAAKAGIPADSFRACMASPEAKAAVEKDIAEGQSLKINSTPTIYVNGRELVGGDQPTLEQYIQYEVSAYAPHNIH